MASVTKTLIVNAPVSQVFAFWKNFENFPRFMENIESIQTIGPDLTHWKAKGPLGTHVEWDARTTYVEENKKIAWQTEEGQIETHGAVLFKEIGPNQTEVTVGLEYNPPGGALGEAVAKLFSDPEDQLEEDLQRFKAAAEGGDISLASRDTTAGSEATLTGHSGPSDSTETTTNSAAHGTPSNTYSSTASAAESDVDGARDSSRTDAPNAVDGVRSDNSTTTIV